MASRFEAASHWRVIFYVNNQTFNLVITPSLAAPNIAPADTFTTRLHKIYAFILPALVGLLQVLHSAGNTTTSECQAYHPVTTSACVLGMLGYYLAFMARLRFPSYATQSSIAMAVFGSFSLASLVTLLLPNPYWYIRYIFYVVLVVIELHQLLKAYLRGSILTMMRRSWSANSATARRLLPLTHMDLREHNI